MNPPNVAPNPVRLRLEFAGKSFLVVAFLGALVAGAMRLRERALARPQHRVDLSHWAVLERPDWVSIEDVSRLRAETANLNARTPGSLSLLDDRALAALEHSFARVPQVRSVSLLRRRMPDRLQVELHLRRPVALVRLDGMTSPEEAMRPEEGGPPRAGSAGSAVRHVRVDAEGVVLGLPTPETPPRGSRIVTGVGATAPAPGGSFGPEVAEAVRLGLRLAAADETDPTRALAGLVEIDVSNFRGRVTRGAGEVVLRFAPAVTLSKNGQPEDGPGGERDTVRPNGVVEWGRFAALCDDPSEPGFASKVAHLRRALSRDPGLRRVRVVKVAFRDLVVVPVPVRQPEPPVPATSR